MQILQKNSLGQEATNLLRKMLLDGHFVEGERLVEDRIAADLGISRTPLREALHRLAQEGLLEKRRAGGYILRPLQRSEIEDAINIRSMLESYAASLAAQRATPEQLQDLRKNLTSFNKAREKKNIPLLVDLNEAFHSLLREAAHAPLLSQLLVELDGVVERMLRQTISSDVTKWSDADHTQILEYIEKGQANKASLAMQKHIDHAKKAILEFLGK